MFIRIIFEAIFGAIVGLALLALIILNAALEERVRAQLAKLKGGALRDRLVGATHFSGVVGHVLFVLLSAFGIWQAYEYAQPRFGTPSLAVYLILLLFVIVVFYFRTWLLGAFRAALQTILRSVSRLPNSGVASAMPRDPDVAYPFVRVPDRPTVPLINTSSRNANDYANLEPELLLSVEDLCEEAKPLRRRKVLIAATCLVLVLGVSAGIWLTWTPGLPDPPLSQVDAGPSSQIVVAPPTAPAPVNSILSLDQNIIGGKLTEGAESKPVDTYKTTGIPRYDFLSTSPSVFPSAAPAAPKFTTRRDLGQRSTVPPVSGTKKGPVATAAPVVVSDEVQAIPAYQEMIAKYGRPSRAYENADGHTIVEYDRVEPADEINAEVVEPGTDRAPIRPRLSDCTARFEFYLTIIGSVSSPNYRRQTSCRADVSRH